jgi:hypothetical protein
MRSLLLFARISLIKFGETEVLGHAHIRFSVVFIAGGSLLVSSAMTSINLADSSDGDDNNDDDFSVPREPPRLRQTLIDEFTRKRAMPEEPLVTGVLDATILAPFVDSFVLTPGDVIRVDQSYNYMDFELDGAPVQVWQSTLDELDEDLASFAFIVDLGASGKKQQTSSVLISDADKLRGLGWGDSGKIKRNLDTTMINTPAKRATMAVFLRETFHLMRSILDKCISARKDDKTVIIVLVCARGLERSLILFNLLAYAAALGTEERRGHHASIDDLCAHVAKQVVLRHERVDSDKNEVRIKNELIHSTIDSLPELVHLALKMPLTERTEKKQRFEQRQRSHSFYLYC